MREVFEEYKECKERKDCEERKECKEGKDCEERKERVKRVTQHLKRVL